MIFSYLGLSNPIKIVNEAINSFIDEFINNHGRTKVPVSRGGIFGNDISAVANFAASNDMCAYITADEMIKRSDVIFCFLPDKALRTLAKSLRGHGIRGKIFCHFSPAFDAEVLDFGEDNTYVSFLLPVYRRTSDGKIKPRHIFAQGYGERFDEAVCIARMLGVDITVMSAEDKTVYLTAANFLNDFSQYIEKAALKLMRISLYSKPELAEDIFKSYLSSDCSLNSYNPVKNSNVRFLENQSDILSSLGLKDVSSLFGSLIYAQSRDANSDDIGFTRIAEVAKRLIVK